jgi:hypothetical protein
MVHTNAPPVQKQAGTQIGIAHEHKHFTDIGHRTKRDKLKMLCTHRGLKFLD